jgi:hypothetical protein
MRQAAVAPAESTQQSFPHPLAARSDNPDSREASRSSSYRDLSIDHRRAIASDRQVIASGQVRA